MQALEDSVLQLEARASIAECSRAAAQQQLSQARQQLAEVRRAYEARLAVLTEQIAHQDAVLAGAAKYLGPLESRAIPLSPVLSPRVQTPVQVSTFLAVAHQPFDRGQRKSWHWTTLSCFFCVCSRQTLLVALCALSGICDTVRFAEFQQGSFSTVVDWLQSGCVA